MDEPIRVLIVEDDLADAELELRALRAAGLHLETRRVDDEDGFLAALAESVPDIILSDYRMPHFDALAVLRLGRERCPKVPIVVVTGSIDEETAAACIQAGAADYVLKERLHRLPAAVSGALERVRLRRASEAAEEARRRAVEQEARQYALLQAVVDSSPMPIFAVDRDGRYIAFNRAHADTMRALYGVEIAVGARLDEAMTVTEDRASAFANIQRALAGASLVDEAYSGEDGRSRRFFTISHGPVRGEGGEVVGAVVVAQDISERRRQEERLRQLLRAVEQSPASIVITDASGAIEYVNPCFEQVTGYAANEVLGRNPRFLQSGRMPPELYRELWDTITGGGRWQGELQNRRKDGTLFWEMASISGVRDASGRVTHFVAVKEDVTERKEEQARLRQAELQLQHAQKMEAIGRLAGGIAHDFNNLLSVILGHGERLRQELGPGHRSVRRIEQVLWSADKAAGLTRQLLAFSRKQVLEPRVVRLDAVAGEARGMLERVLGEDVELDFVTPQVLGSVRADPGQLVQVLLNLAVNARDAMPRGGRLTVAFEDVHLDESFAETHHPVTAGRYVMMSVSDTGHGMDAETQRRIFEPFFTTKPEGQGTGLGLATVYGIVRQSGGFVWVDSEVGQGTRFRIYLPRIEQAPEPAADRSARPSRPKEGLRLLLVEDDAGVRGLMKDLLEAEGYAVEAAAHPEEAVALAASRSFDLLVTDVIMPGLSGRELARRLLECGAVPRVVYVSGYAGETLARHGGIAPGERFLQKPFTEIALLDVVAAALEEGPPAPEGA
jgi:PAS domain S-box-containing protein